MKTKLLLIAGLFTIFLSCGLEDPSKSDCFIEVEDNLYFMEKTYNSAMADVKDSAGNTQSLEACIMRRELTEEYIIMLKTGRSNINSQDYNCTRNEINTLNSRFDERMQELEEDMESTWNHCEDRYGA